MRDKRRKDGDGEAGYDEKHTSNETIFIEISAVPFTCSDHGQVTYLTSLRILSSIIK